MEELFSVLVIMIEAACFMLFFYSFVKEREVSLKRQVIIYLILVSYIFLLCKIVKNVDNNFIIKQAAFIIFASIVGKVGYGEKLLKSFIVSLSFQGLLLVADALTYLVIISMFATINLNSIDKLGAGNLTILIGKMILLTCIVLIKILFDKKSIGRLSNKQWMELCIFPVFSIVITSVLFKNYQMYGDVNQLPFLYILEFGLIIMNIFEFFLIEDIIKRENRIYEIDLLDMQMKKQLGMYKTMAESLNDQKSKIHDFNNKISCLSTLIYEEKYDELKHYVDELETEIKKDGVVYATNNIIIDAIINNKYRTMVEKGILLIAKIEDAKDIKIPDDDIVVILSNLLDNAIEACDKCDDNKYIKLKIEKNEDGVIIAVKNGYDVPLNMDKGYIGTTKTNDFTNHGYGIKNILAIVEKHNGDYSISYDDSDFLFSILIPEK